MADRNEEQLLNELLADIRVADAKLSADGLQSRVVRAFESMAGSKEPDPPDLPYVPYAYRAGAFAAAAACLLAAAALWNAQPDASLNMPAVQSPTLLAESQNTPLPIPPLKIESRSVEGRRPEDERLTRTTEVRPELEFVALVPMTERELSGSFQIVRVQLPRASFGAWTSPLEDPHELVETDVLLGEDGVARAIRVSTETTLSPWRSR